MNKLLFAMAVLTSGVCHHACAIGPADGGALPPRGTLKAEAPLLIESGQKLAFMGDSITDFGDDMPGGYCRLVIDMLRQHTVDVTPVYAGHGGDTSMDMLARLDRDVLAARPDWLAISCGVNDAWHSARLRANQLDKLVPLNQFQKNITAIVDQCEAAETRVILLTPTMIGEDPRSDDNQRLAPYVDWMIEFALLRNLPLADINALMHEAVKTQPYPGRQLPRIYTSDGVHMNPRGFRLMARGLLRTIGFSDTEITAQLERWMDMPDGWIVRARMENRETTPEGLLRAYHVGVQMAITPRQFSYLEFLKPRGPNALYFIPQADVIPRLLKDSGGPFDSIKAVVTSPDFEHIQKQIDEDCGLLLADTVAKARSEFEKYLAGLKKEQRAKMESNRFQ